MDLAVLIKLVGGLFALVVGVRQALRLPARPAAVSSSGSIVRMQASSQKAEAASRGG
jgi:hypothetical protein